MLTWKQVSLFAVTNSPPDSILIKERSLVMMAPAGRAFLMRAWVAKPVCPVDYVTQVSSTMILFPCVHDDLFPC
jgi:hypothetical protein